jgi:hypothetical protein
MVVFGMGFRSGRQGCGWFGERAVVAFYRVPAFAGVTIEQIAA